MAVTKGDMQSIATAGEWITETGGGGDTTPPSPPTGLSLQSRTATSLTISFTPPTDSDLSTIEWYANGQNGGDDGTANSATSPVTISSLSAGKDYAVVGVAKDTSGNRSTPAVLEPCVRTAAVGTITHPIKLYWYEGRSATAHPSSPAELDPAITDGPQSRELSAASPTLRLRATCDRPVHFEVLELALDVLIPMLKPYGHKVAQ